MGVVSSDFLLRGGWYALEHAGRLVNEATVLFEAGSHSTAAGLALLSREELAKSRKLFALWMRAARGEQITRDQMLEDIDIGHVEKQRHGASTFSIPVDAVTLEVLKGERDVPLEEYDEVRRKLNAQFERLMKTAPTARHQQRLRAFYVDPSRDGDTWLRPSDLTRSEAEDILVHARNDYWQHRSPVCQRGCLISTR
jgi:AbiV family abortive infection protein